MQAMHAAAILLVLCGCDRVFFLDHIAPTVTDARTDDGSSSGDADGTFSCAMHAFCDDFNRTGPVIGAWDMLVDTSEGSIELTSSKSVSPPTALGVAFSTPTSEVYLIEGLPAPTQKLVMNVELSLELSDTSAEVDLIVLRWKTPPTGCTSARLVLVARGSRQLALQETYSGCAAGLIYHDVGQLSPGFHHVRVEVSVGIAPSSISVMATDVGSTTFTAAVAFPPSETELWLGAPFISAGLGTQWQLLFDNVAVDAI